ncbi:hypothetical protein [Lederbergia citrea]|nr:hypothetical protein [Lederbergia citrea]
MIRNNWTLAGLSPELAGLMVNSARLFMSLAGLSIDSAGFVI